MRYSAVCAVFLAIGVIGPGAVVPASAQSPSKSYLFQEQRFRNACRPPLKFAAGACVRRCPAGYQDFGGYCRLRSMRR